MRNSKIDYNKASEIFSAMSNPKRLQILHLVSGKEMSVNEIAEVVNINKSNTSQHLFVLRMMGLVKSRREGKNIFYKLINPKIIDSLMVINRL